MTATNTPEGVVPREVARVLVYVALYRREHGHGPTWREIAETAGWPVAGFHAPPDEKRAYQQRFRELVPYGFRFERGVKHSADVTEEGLEDALLAVRAGREGL
jgi:hypothetical protein